MGLDVQKIRSDFPILGLKINKKPLVYFDNGATTQKPNGVINLVNNLHSQSNSNIHRGVHQLSEKMTEAYENSRKTIHKFINSKHPHEIIFTSGATGSINAVAFSFGEKYVNAGDEIVISAMEHHANIVPWQMLCERKGATLKVIPMNDSGELLLNQYKKLLTPRTKIVTVTHISNTLGTINPVKEIIEIAHSRNVPVLIDGAQSIQHEEIDVRDMDCDFYVFSGHKVYGPTGVGVLYGKEKWLNDMPPYQGGGDMVDKVTFEKTTYNKLPFKFEAGTTNYIGAVGLGEAIEYIKQAGLGNIAAYEHELLEYATLKLSSIEGLRIYGTAKEKACIISFLIDKIHHYDTGYMLDQMGVAIRTGTHCTQPIMDRFNITGTARVSMSFYNTKEEIDILYNALLQIKKIFN